MLITNEIDTLDQALIVAAQYAIHEKRDWFVARSLDTTTGLSYGICPSTYRPDTHGWELVVRVGPAPEPVQLPLNQPIERAARDIRNALAGMVGMDAQRADMAADDLRERIQDVRATLQRAMLSVETAARDVANVLTAAQLSDREYDVLRGALQRLPDQMVRSHDCGLAAIDRLRGRPTVQVDDLPRAEIAR